MSSPAVASGCNEGLAGLDICGDEFRETWTQTVGTITIERIIGVREKQTEVWPSNFLNDALPHRVVADGTLQELLVPVPG